MRRISSDGLLWEVRYTHHSDSGGISSHEVHYLPNICTSLWLAVFFLIPLLSIVARLLTPGDGSRQIFSFHCLIVYRGHKLRANTRACATTVPQMQQAALRAEHLGSKHENCEDICVCYRRRGSVVNSVDDAFQEKRIEV